MNTEGWAALGCRRGPGESLASWLRAGPLGTQAVEQFTATPSIGGDLYCPACRLDEAGGRRWYTREEWPVDGVVCTTHALPLLRLDVPPIRLRGRRWPSLLRAEFRALGEWTRQGCGGQVGRAITHAVCARSDPQMAYSRAWAEAQWRLWVSGWPIPVSPRPFQGRLAPRLQSDRLALTAITHRVWATLENGQGTGWPPLPIRPRVLVWLKGRLVRIRPALHSRLALCFRETSCLGVRK